MYKYTVCKVLFVGLANGVYRKHSEYIVEVGNNRIQKSNKS
jgi:hypothetical protein